MNDIQFSCITQSCLTLCDPMDCSTQGFPVHHKLPELTQTHVHWVGDAIQPSHPLSSPSPPTFNLSQHQGLFSELALHIRWPKYWSFSFSICPTNEYSGLISFRINLFDLLAVQRTLSRVHHSLQFESINSFESIIQPSLWSNSHPSVTTGKIIALTIRTFVSKVMCLLFNMLSRFVIYFLPWSKSLNLMAAVTVHSDFGAQENKICHCFHFFPFCLPSCDGTGWHGLSFLNVEF